MARNLDRLAADQRIHACIVDMIRDQHDASRGAFSGSSEPAALVRIRFQCRAAFSGLDDGAHDGGIAAFIGVRPARSTAISLPPNLPTTSSPAWPEIFGTGKPSNRRKECATDPSTASATSAEARSQYDGDFRGAAFKAFRGARSCEILRPEGCGKQFVEREGLVSASPSSPHMWIFTSALGEFADFLPAAAAWGAEHIAGADHRHFGDRRAAGHDHGGDGGGFGARALRIGGIFDIAAGVDAGRARRAPRRPPEISNRAHRP